MMECDGVRLRPLEPEDLDLLHAWACDEQLGFLSGWGPPEGRAAFHQRRREPDPVAGEGARIQSWP
ncbi:MAG: hypothetical protein Q8O14_11090 [bacterium]|jgi:RimJ/RimL family protein N-acetyltransferase|nr:hypothetical protein [bacterium]